MVLLDVVARLWEMGELKVNNWTMLSDYLQLTALNHSVCYMRLSRKLTSGQMRPFIFTFGHAIDPSRVETRGVASSHFDMLGLLDNKGAQSTSLQTA
jgi:hypothetical protein